LTKYENFATLEIIKKEFLSLHVDKKCQPPLW
jgi:hypothetical protein